MRLNDRLLTLVALACLLAATSCTYLKNATSEHTTDRDKMKKGAAIGAVSGAFLGAILGEGELDEILAGAAIGAGVGAGVGTYMDNQEEQLARIPGTTVERKDKDLLLVRFDSDILFAVDSSQLNSAAYATLDQAAAVLAEYKKTAIIAQGHTDSTGSDSHNQDLSERRARSVSRYLVDQGIDSTRVTSLGYGEAHPVADNSTTYGREQNRRVDLLLKAKVR